jgi:hypothetical protein
MSVYTRWPRPPFAMKLHHARIVQKERNGCFQGKLPSPRTYFMVCP